jgi:ribosomal protein L7/L12
MPEELTDEQIEQLTDSLAGGSKIEAIKLYRKFTGKGLAEAKQFIDQLVPKLKEQDPERYAQLGEKSAGCASAVLVSLGLAALTYWWT